MAARGTASERLRKGGSYVLGVASDLAAQASHRLAARDGGLTLEGDRWVEWSFCMARLAHGEGATLDFGADIGLLALAAAQRGHEVVALDREPPALDYEHPRVVPHRADILDRPLADRRFDQIINCSSVEHVGLTGRYGSFEAPGGDLQAMEIMAEMLRPGGRMILTIPVGRDMVCAPYHRIYGPDRLPRLLARYELGEEQYWRKDAASAKWIATDRSTALSTEGSRSFYSLGLFVLQAADS
jgi:SAM-dependent methyltransferase